MDSECIEVYVPPESGQGLRDSPDKELSETVAAVVETPKWIDSVEEEESQLSNLEMVHRIIARIVLCR